MLGNAIDNLISVVSPSWGVRRMQYREYGRRLKASSAEHQMMRKFLGSRSAGGYEAGKLDRLKGRIVGSPHENDVPRAQINALRWRSWNLYRNNPQARKIIRTLKAKVIGRGLSPQPQATTKDGAPFSAYRKRARQVWEEFCKECDFRGKPGSGGQNFVSLCGTSLSANVLSGGTLYRFHHVDRKEQRDKGLFVPLLVQLLHVDRIDETKHGGNWFYGVKLDDQGRVAGYQVLKGGVSKETIGTAETEEVSAKEMKHLFAEEDIDQLLGAPWIGAALLTADDRRNYEYSEIIGAEMASCAVGTYRLSPGQTKPGLPTQESTELTDGDGNPVTHFQPGMLLNLGSRGEFDIKSANRPNSSAEGFLSHLVRSEAVSMPGVKSSTLTGDYRNSSFSSERSADNDVWPELEGLQDWMAIGFCQPIYEECIKTAVTAGLFADVKDFSVADFNERRRDFLRTNWQGPVPRSINPRDDAEASRLRVKNASSSPQREAAQIGRDWREILQEVDEFIDYANELELPEDIWQQALGMEQLGKESGDATSRQTEQEQDAAAAVNRLVSSGFAAFNKA